LLVILAIMIADILKSTNEKTQNWFKGLVTKLLIFFIFFVSQAFRAQQSKEYVRKSIENWNFLMRNDLNALRDDAFKTMKRAYAENDRFALNVGKRNLGTYLSRTGRHEKGATYLKEAALFFTIMNDAQLAAETWNEAGNSILLQGNPKESIICYLRSLRIGKESSDETSSFLAESNFAQACLQLGDTLKAAALLKHYKSQCLRLEKWESTSNAYALLGQIEEARANKSLAMEYYEKSAKYGKLSKSNLSIAQAKNNLAIVHFNDKDFIQSLKLFQEAYYLRCQSGNIRSIAESLYNFGDYYFQLNQTDKAISSFRKAQNYAYTKKLMVEFKDATIALVEVFKSKGKLKEALTEMETLVKKQAILSQELNFGTEKENDEMIELERIRFSKEGNVFTNETSHSVQGVSWIIYGLFSLLILAMIVIALRKQ
jgi:tetratricopeptide (TPR) repeat protein